MNRRRYLQLTATTFAVGSAGCNTGDRTDVPSSTRASPTPSPTAERTRTERTATESPQDDARTIFVSPDGADGNPGTRDAPVRDVPVGDGIRHTGGDSPWA